MMKMKLYSAIFTLILAVSTLHAETKRYKVRSGIIEYATTGSGNMMGIETQMSGTNRVVFKAWGEVELHQSTTESVVMGRKEKTQDTTKIENGKVYVVDYEQKIIVAYEASKLMHTQYKDLAKSSKEMLKEMGGKKVGEGSILGYQCEIWEMPQIKLWLYKGIALKSEANIMGITNTMEATNVQLDISISEDQFKLPDFPVKSMQEAHSPSEMPQMTPDQIQQMQEMMKNFTLK